MIFTIKNKITGELYPFHSRIDMDIWCKSKGIKLNTLEKAFRDGRSPNEDYELVSNSKVRNSHLASMMSNESRVLVVGDLHAPFHHPNYLDFCKGVYDKYRCNKVVFIGDILDNHCMSYHENSVEAEGLNIEFDKAYREIQRWHTLFPEAVVTLGNHDSLVLRKAQSGSIGKHWIKEFKEVLNTPKWEFVTRKVIDGVLYTHGTGRQARNRCLEDHLSVAQGHFHSKSYIEYYIGSVGQSKFAMQVGCGVDITSYAMAYGKDFARPHINCGVVIGGRQAYLEYMEVENENKVD